MHHDNDSHETDADEACDEGDDVIGFDGSPIPYPDLGPSGGTKIKIGGGGSVVIGDGSSNVTDTAIKGILGIGGVGGSGAIFTSAPKVIVEGAGVSRASDLVVKQ